jgi:hypothetical protein
MAVWQGVPMDSLKYHQGPPCSTLLRPTGKPPPKRPYARFRGGPPTAVAQPQGGRPAAIFYPLGHPTPYVSFQHQLTQSHCVVFAACYEPICAKCFDNLLTSKKVPFEIFLHASATLWKMFIPKGSFSGQVKHHKRRE